MYYELQGKSIKDFYNDLRILRLKPFKREILDTIYQFSGPIGKFKYKELERILVDDLEAIHLRNLTLRYQ